MGAVRRSDERFPHAVAAIGTYVEREAERLAAERQDDRMALPSLDLLTHDQREQAERQLNGDDSGHLDPD